MSRLAQRRKGRLRDMATAARAARFGETHGVPPSHRYLLSGSQTFLHGDGIDCCPFDLATDADRVRQWWTDYEREAAECEARKTCRRCPRMFSADCHRDKLADWRADYFPDPDERDYRFDLDDE